MKLNFNKLKLGALVLTVSVAVMAAIFSMPRNMSVSTTQPMGVMAQAHIIITDGNGRIVADHVTPTDLITTVGVNDLKTALGTGAVLNITNMTLANCTATQAIGDTNLCGGTAGDEYNAGPYNCGLAPAAGQYSSFGNGQWNVTYTWTVNSTCTNIIVNSTGVYNQTGSGHLFAEMTWSPSDTLQSNYKYNVTLGFQQASG